MFEKLELSTSEFEYACRKWGIKINTGKTKAISDTQTRIRIDGADIENIDSFIYLGSIVPNSTDDIIRRTALAAQLFGRLQAVIWRNRVMHQFEFKRPSVQFTDCANSYVCC